MNCLTIEQDFLLALARMVWVRREAAKRSGLAFNEETITETILLDLATGYPGDVQIVCFSKPREAETGADWLWSFINVDESLSLTMLVQAKRLGNAENVYHSLNRNVGNRKPPVRQIDQLLATAQGQDVPATYAFYNHVTDASRVPRKCGSLDPDDPDQLLGFGITLAGALSVARALPDETFDVHLGHSIPLHCLLCSVGLGMRPSGGTPELAAINLLRRGLTISVEGAGPETPGLRRGLHPVVEMALREKILIAEGRGSFAADHLPGIAGVVVFRDVRPE